MNVSSGAAKVFKCASFFSRVGVKLIDNNKYVFIVAGLSTFQPPLASLHGGPLI